VHFGPRGKPSSPLPPHSHGQIFSHGQAWTTVLMRRPAVATGVLATMYAAPGGTCLPPERGALAGAAATAEPMSATARESVPRLRKQVTESKEEQYGPALAALMVSNWVRLGWPSWAYWPGDVHHSPAGNWRYCYIAASLGDISNLCRDNFF